jgi:hypothetical protein
MTAPADLAPVAALERLAAAISPGEFATTLTTGAGRRPRLTVCSRSGSAAEDVYADGNGWFWWPWAERIAATSDPLTAACRVSAALRGSTVAGGRR